MLLYSVRSTTETRALHASGCLLSPRLASVYVRNRWFFRWNHNRIHGHTSALRPSRLYLRFPFPPPWWWACPTALLRNCLTRLGRTCLDWIGFKSSPRFRPGGPFFWKVAVFRGFYRAPQHSHRDLWWLRFTTKRTFAWGVCGLVTQEVWQTTSRTWWKASIHCW